MIDIKLRAETTHSINSISFTDPTIDEEEVVDVLADTLLANGDLFLTVDNYDLIEFYIKLDTEYLLLLINLRELILKIDTDIIKEKIILTKLEDHKKDLDMSKQLILELINTDFTQYIDIRVAELKRNVYEYIRHSLITDSNLTNTLFFPQIIESKHFTNWLLIGKDVLADKNQVAEIIERELRFIDNDFQDFIVNTMYKEEKARLLINKLFATRDFDAFQHAANNIMSWISLTYSNGSSNKFGDKFSGKFSDEFSDKFSDEFSDGSSTDSLRARLYLIVRFFKKLQEHPESIKDLVFGYYDLEDVPKKYFNTADKVDRYIDIKRYIEMYSSAAISTWCSFNELSFIAIALEKVDSVSTHVYIFKEAQEAL